ncbi:MAG TPA: AMP-binding protein [Acidimicrobiales bacterium]
MAAAAAGRHGDRLAVADGETRLTYAELHDEARTFGAALVASGIEPRDRVALWAPNGAEWIVAVLGLFQAGAVLVPVNTRFKGVEAADILKAGILACVAAGAAMLPEPVFDVDRVLARVAGEEVTVLPGPPTLYQSILDHPDRSRHDLSSLRVAVTGAADIPVALVRRVADELPFSTIVTGYGLTEAGTASATAPDDDAETIATTVGRPRPGFEVRILGDHDRDLPAGETGEVVLRGPSVMAGYLDDPAATTATLSPEGWLRTGDLGVIDERGRLRIVGRSKDMFIVGGFNAYPAEIEDHLLRHPEVQQAAVIGIPDERLGEVGMAFVVARSGDPAVGADLLAWCRDRMANYKVPRAIEIVDQLPVNATGKVVKDELRARAAPGRRGPARAGDTAGAGPAT